MSQAQEISEVLQALSQARSGYLKAAQSHQSDPGFRPKPGEWSATQVGSHMAEWSEFFLSCLRKMEADPDFVIGRRQDDPARLSGVERRSHLPLQQTSSIVASTWDEIFAVLGGWSEQIWFRPYRHLHYETDSALGRLRRAVSHFDGHAKQLERIQNAAAADLGEGQ